MSEELWGDKKTVRKSSGRAGVGPLPTVITAALHRGLWYCGVFFFSALLTGAAERPVPWPSDPKLNNPWPAAWESEYQQRVEHVLGVWKSRKSGGTTYGESEKALYPSAMFALLNGRTNEALKSLQETDNQAGSDHAHTLGIDYYWCFTLKGQVRKYFYFGRWLDPAHKQGSVAESVGQNGAIRQQPGESVTRGDRRRRELEAQSSSPPLARLPADCCLPPAGEW